MNVKDDQMKVGHSSKTWSLEGNEYEEICSLIHDKDPLAGSMTVRKVVVFF